MTAVPSTSAADAPPLGRLVVLGLGLLGGSVALAARNLGLAQHTIGVSRPGRSYAEAVAQGVVDSWTDRTEEALEGADLVVLGAPVDVIRTQLPEVLRLTPPGALVTDVGSTKQAIVEAAEALGSAPASFVGSHPMVGGHQTGWQHARADLFQRQTVYVTLTPRTSLPALARLVLFWERLGARVVITDPARHDALCALLSHMPHFTAVAIVESLAEAGEDAHLVKLLSGNGLRDTTRVAMGSTQMWLEIAQQNGERIAALLDGVADNLHRLANTIRTGDAKALASVLDRASSYRQKL